MECIPGSAGIRPGADEGVEAVVASAGKGATGLGEGVGGRADEGADEPGVGGGDGGADAGFETGVGDGVGGGAGGAEGERASGGEGKEREECDIGDAHPEADQKGGCFWYWVFILAWEEGVFRGQFFAK